MESQGPRKQQPPSGVLSQKFVDKVFVIRAAFSQFASRRTEDCSPGREKLWINPWMDKSVSRRGARYAKVAKKSKEFAFVFLCALPTLRELF